MAIANIEFGARRGRSGETTRRPGALRHAMQICRAVAGCLIPGFLREIANLKKISAPRRTEGIKCA
jgi:hypothetical protein